MGSNTLSLLSPDVFQNKPVRIAAFGLLLALLSGCGSSMSARTDLASSGYSTDLSVIGGEGQAQCSTFDSPSTRLAGRVTTYSTNGVFQEDKARVRITRLVEAYDTNPNYFLQAFRWKINGSGTPEIDATPVQFTIENGSGVAVTSPLTSLSIKDITAIRLNGISATSSIDFFSKTAIIFNGVDYNWQALKLVVYDNSTVPPSPVGESNILIPIFQANPVRYAASHSATLVALHPFISQSSVVTTEADWASRAQSFCF